MSADPRLNLAQRVAALQTAMETAPIADPLDVLDIRDDFVSGGSSSGNIGSLGWITGGGTVTPGSPNSTHPGVMRRDTGATAATRTYTHLRATPATGVFSTITMFETWWIIKPEQVDTDCRYAAGMSSDWSTDAGTSAVYLEKAFADTNWFVVCRNAGTETRKDTGVAVIADFVKVYCRRVDSTHVGFSVNGGAEIVFDAATENVPSTNMQPGTLVLNQAAVNKQLSMDYFRARVSGLGR